MSQNTPKSEGHVYRSEERRRHLRYEAEEGSFVFFGSEPTMAGKVLDIGKQGIGFTYLAKKPLTLEPMNLSLMSTQRSFQCRGLIGKRVFDVQVQGETVSGKRRCGVAFEGLTEKEMTDIENFITWCTVGPG